MKIVLLPQAQADLDEIYDPVLARVLRRLRYLERFPEPFTQGPMSADIIRQDRDRR